MGAWRFETAGSGCEALERLQSNHGPDLVIVDLARGDVDGLYALRWLRRMRPGLPIILLGFADDAHHDEAIRLGARDYLLKPVNANQLHSAIRRHLHGVSESDSDHDLLNEEIIQVREDRFFMAGSGVMRKLRTQAELLAQIDAPLLIVGESGSGKNRPHSSCRCGRG